MGQTEDGKGHSRIKTVRKWEREEEEDGMENRMKSRKRKTRGRRR